MARQDFLRRLWRFLNGRDFWQHPVKAVYRRIYWRLHWRLWADMSFIVPYFGGLRIELAQSSASSGIYLNDGFSDRSIAYLFVDFLKPGMVALDCGAHIGEYALLFAALTGPGGEVHGFEPDPRIFRYLQHNVASNGLRNVVVNNVALGDSVGPARFVLRADPTVSSLDGRPEFGGGVKEVLVPVTTLDRYVEINGISRVDALKINVEGAEMALLEGARQILSQFKPGLIRVEIDGREKPSALGKFLECMGYDVTIHEDPYHLYPYAIARRATLR